MKRHLAILITVLLGLTAQSALAHDHRHYRSSVGIYFGPPWVYAPYPAYFPPYYPRAYYPPVVVTQPAPVYVEQPVQPAAPPQPPEQQYWYYCPASSKYYPYVRDCPQGWQKVIPDTPANAEPPR